MQFKAKDIARETIKLGPDGSVYDARNVMVKYNIGRVVVVDKHNKVLGIITEKDIARFLYQEVSNRHLNEIRLDEVMSKNLITVTEDQDVNSCAKIMIENNISSIIVVNNEKNDDGYPTRIFTKTDLVEAYARQYIGKHRTQQKSKSACDKTMNNDSGTGKNNNNNNTNPRILLVDDDYDILLTFKIGLEDSGFVIDTFTDSLLALSNFKAGITTCYY
jgi:CBS domain-containing protein